MYSTPEAARRARVPYRVLDYWTRNGVLEPTERHQGSGSRHRWSDQDVARLVQLASIWRHLNQVSSSGGGVSTDVLRQVWRALREGAHWQFKIEIYPNGEVELR